MRASLISLIGEAPLTGPTVKNGDAEAANFADLVRQASGEESNGEPTSLKSQLMGASSRATPTEEGANRLLAQLRTQYSQENTDVTADETSSLETEKNKENVIALTPEQAVASVQTDTDPAAKADGTSDSAVESQNANLPAQKDEAGTDGDLLASLQPGQTLPEDVSKTYGDELSVPYNRASTAQDTEGTDAAELAPKQALVSGAQTSDKSERSSRTGRAISDQPANSATPKPADMPVFEPANVNTPRAEAPATVDADMPAPMKQWVAGEPVGGPPVNLAAYSPMAKSDATPKQNGFSGREPTLKDQSALQPPMEAEAASLESKQSAEPELHELGTDADEPRVSSDRITAPQTEAVSGNKAVVEQPRNAQQVQQAAQVEELTQPKLKETAPIAASEQDAPDVESVEAGRSGTTGPVDMAPETDTALKTQTGLDVQTQTAGQNVSPQVEPRPSAERVPASVESARADKPTVTDGTSAQSQSQQARPGADFANIMSNASSSGQGQTSPQSSPAQMNSPTLLSDAQLAELGEAVGDGEFDIAALQAAKGHAGAEGTAQSAAARTPHSAQMAAMVSRVGEQFLERFNGQSSKFEIRLDPPELGKVDIRVEVGRDGKVMAVLSARDPSVADALMRGAKTLENALTQAGLNLSEGGVSVQLDQRNASGSGAHAGQFAQAGEYMARQESEMLEADDIVPPQQPIFETWSRPRLDLTV